MAIAKCCITGCPAITDTLYDFPPKHSEEYNIWLSACKEFEANIIFKQNPMICLLHFEDTNIDEPPKRYLNKKAIDILNDDLGRVNHCVAEWVLFIRKHAPNVNISDEDVYAKAMEIGRVYQLPYFEFGIDFGWLCIFENHLRTRGIESWNRDLDRYESEDQEDFGSEEFMASDFEADSMDVDADGNANANANKKEKGGNESISTYEEALRRVEVLQSYCKRTNNNSALEIVERLSKVLQKRV